MLNMKRKHWTADTVHHIHGILVLVDTIGTSPDHFLNFYLDLDIDEPENFCLVKDLLK
jgi:hypothetical protein